MLLSQITLSVLRMNSTKYATDPHPLNQMILVLWNIMYKLITNG